MPLPSTIAAHQTALVRIVAGLFALLGLTSGKAPERIARHLHRVIARTLRPAESATRRVIVFLAAGLKAKPPQPRQMPADFVRANGGGEARKQRPSFKLFDPRPRLLFAQRKAKPRAAPRISFFSGGEMRTLSLAPAPRPASDGLQTSACLVRRLQALHAALENLPRQAQRLARALARRAQSQSLKLRGPLRPGRPPGFRQRPREEVDILLHRCDWLARDVLPDTS